MVPARAYKSSMFEPPALHLALAGTDPAAPTVREALAWARSVGVAGVRLDATRAGLRPRELGPSARRDLAGALRRDGLRFGGLDLFIPPAHFGSPDTAERAFDAARGAVSLARDLADLAGDDRSASVSLVLAAGTPGAVVGALDDAAGALGVTIADEAHPVREGPAHEAVRVGIDAARVLASGASPAKLAASLGDRLAGARLDDLDDAGRCEVGAPGGRLDLTAYAAALAVAGLDRVTLDVRGTRDAARAARAGVQRWREALIPPGF